MLPRNQRMELLSRAYVQAVVAQAGGLCASPIPDYGFDFNIHRVGLTDGRYTDEGAVMHLQLKSTTDAPYQEDADAFQYDLDVRTYNHLRTEGTNAPRYLVLYRMPTDELLWLSQDREEMLLRHCAYYLSLAGMPETQNPHRIRVFVPRQQVFSVDFLRGHFQEG